LKVEYGSGGGGVRSEKWGRFAVGVADVEQLLISVAHTKLLIQLFTLFLAADKPRTHFHRPSRVLFRETVARRPRKLPRPKIPKGEWVWFGDGVWYGMGMRMVLWT